MCTALRFGDYFGRNLDLHCSYGEQVCVMPRRFPLEFRHGGTMTSHYALIGMAMVVEGVPLYYDACNEKGLAMAGLNFPGNARYFPPAEGKDNVASFEFIPWVLSQCGSVREARGLLERINLAETPFSAEIPNSPLHWMLGDGKESLVVESMKDGLHIYDNPADVMSNNPPFPYHLMNLNNYRALRVDTPPNTFGGELELNVYCQGLGALGLPGDVSSMSRFVRLAFGVKNGVEADGLSQCFHLLDSVKMIRGCCKTGAGDWDITVYSSIMDTRQGLYYYTTYGNRQIQCVDLHREDVNGTALRLVPLVTEQQIAWQN